MRHWIWWAWHKPVGPSRTMPVQHHFGFIELQSVTARPRSSLKKKKIWSFSNYSCVQPGRSITNLWHILSHPCIFKTKVPSSFLPPISSARIGQDHSGSADKKQQTLSHWFWLPTFNLLWAGRRQGDCTLLRPHRAEWILPSALNHTRLLYQLSNLDVLEGLWCGSPPPPLLWYFCSQVSFSSLFTPHLPFCFCPPAIL